MSCRRSVDTKLISTHIADRNPEVPTPSRAANPTGHVNNTHVRPATGGNFRITATQAD